jgi:phosphoglycolate phosphatase-like HAD superfamily hydrolase
VIAALRKLPEPPVIGLLTGNIRLGAQLKLTYYHLWDHFQTGGFADDHEERNNIAVIARDRGNRLVQRKLDGEEVLVVGDTPLDIACARAIDAKILAVATGSYALDQLREHAPTWAVTDLKQVCVQEVCGR